VSWDSQFNLYKIPSSLATDRGVVSLTTTNDLFWRVLADVDATTIQRLAELFGERTIGPAAVSIVTGFTEEL